MKHWIVWLILALSLLFNVFFAAGFVQARAQARLADRPREIAQLVSERLQLDDEQRAVFTRLREAMADETALLNDAIALSQQELIDELGRPRPDLDRIRAIVAQETELHRQRRDGAGRRFNEFLRTLSPEQCRLLSRHVHRGPRGRMRFDLLRRFDADGDGQLDEAERAEAKAFMDERRREHEQRREEMLQRFDADGDGQLDPEERDRMRGSMRQRREGRRR